jgi:hypothetical protein
MVNRLSFEISPVAGGASLASSSDSFSPYRHTDDVDIGLLGRGSPRASSERDALAVCDHLTRVGSYPTGQGLHSVVPRRSNLPAGCCEDSRIRA